MMVWCWRQHTFFKASPLLSQWKINFSVYKSSVTAQIRYPLYDTMSYSTRAIYWYNCCIIWFPFSGDIEPDKGKFHQSDIIFHAYFKVRLRSTTTRSQYPTILLLWSTHETELQIKWRGCNVVAPLGTVVRSHFNLLSRCTFYNITYSNTQ